MPIEWAGLGPELLLALDRSRPEPLRVQLERELREAIRSGRLAAGERLPSSRALAAELGISRGLVLECYSQLQAEGFLTSRTGSATRVAAGALSPAGALAAPGVLAASGALATPAAGAPTPASAPTGPLPTGPVPEQRLAVDFCPGVPDLTSFPRADWARAMRDSCRSATPTELGYGDPRGTETLRNVLAGYLRRVRGTVAEADQIVICGGFGQGINLVLRPLAGDGVLRVAIEDPGDDDYLEICSRLGIEAVPVPIDERGIDVDALAATDVRAVILTPTHQFPTGTALAPERRQALVAWSQQCDGMIIEDDYDAEFRYDRDPVGALQGLAPDRVALIGTVSKSLAPALRLGWVVCPRRLLDAVTEDKRLSDRGSPTLEQLALARLIESGRYDRHLRRMREVYGRRRDRLVATLAEHAPHVALHGLAAGFHAVASLGPDADEAAVVEDARARSIGLYGMSEYRPGPSSGPPQIVLGFGHLTEAAIGRGIEAVADLL
ncbi:MAG TPA: PLP-dependent aminotransferase family protein [Solirubrobacteraceae bacterium]|nr:PLP-dependent aminotransferase family protein [Solirubrobacteraceae bacterium]